MLPKDCVNTACPAVVQSASIRMEKGERFMTKRENAAVSTFSSLLRFLYKPFLHCNLAQS
jgi:hypothetical protein